MPIVIKEFLLSDSISELSEKLNFNFDQIVLAGGGPPGPIGPQGIPGVVGPQGTRGDHWFIGSTTLGLTADHDGVSSLEMQDLFLDNNGNVYKYFEIGGATGWTSTGINLKGPSGTIGGTGGSLEWSLIDFSSNNLQGSYYGPINQPANPANLNFIIPNYSEKNSIFIGDPDWSYVYLENFGTNPSNANQADENYVPKLTLIQNQINTVGLNGISFGAYGLTATNVGSSVYGSTSSITDGNAFVNASFLNEQISGGVFKTSWRLYSPRTTIKIQAGGAGGEAYPAKLDLRGNEVVLSNYNFSNAIKLKDLSDINNSTYIVGKLRELSINSYGSLQSLDDPANLYGYVGLQNEIGGSQPMIQHQYGNVIIGPTTSSSAFNPANTVSGLGLLHPQALAIVRDITQPDTVDAAMRFIYPKIMGSPSTRLNKNKSTWVGSIVHSRSNFGHPDLDYLVFSSGLGRGIIPGVTGGGRIGFVNNVLHGTEGINTSYIPQHNFHVSIVKDIWSGKNGWDSGQGGAYFEIPSGPTGYLDYFYAGFDTRLSWYGLNSRRGVGIGFGAKEFRDLLGATSLLPVLQTYYTGDSIYYSQDTNYLTTNPGDNAYAQGINVPNLYIQPYDVDASWGNIGNVAIGFMPKSVNGLANGNYSSYPYSKLSVAGSVTIAGPTSTFHTVYASRPKNSLLLESPIIVGATYPLYQFGSSLFDENHFFNIAVNNGGGLASPNARPSAMTGGTPPSQIISALSASFNKLVLGGHFLARYGGIASPFPDFAFADARTGIRLKYTGTYVNGYTSSGFTFRGDNVSPEQPPYTGKIGVGQLVASPAHQLNDFSQSSYIAGGIGFTASKVVAEWASSGDANIPYWTDTIAANDAEIDRNTYPYFLPAPAPPYTIGGQYSYESNTDYSSFKITDTLSQSVQYKDFSELEKRYFFLNVATGGGMRNYSGYSEAPLKYRAIYYKIPTNKSVCIINADYVYKGQYYDYVTRGGEIRRFVNTGQDLYLNGESVSGSNQHLTDHRDQNRGWGVNFSDDPYINGGDFFNILINAGYGYAGTNVNNPIDKGLNYDVPNTQGIQFSKFSLKKFNAEWPTNFAFLEDGHYIGQEFTLYCSRIDDRNSFFLDSAPPHEGLLKRWEDYQKDPMAVTMPNTKYRPQGGRSISGEKIKDQIDNRAFPGTKPPWEYFNAYSNHNDIRLKSKTNILFPKGADGNFAPSTPYGRWLPPYGQSDTFSPIQKIDSPSIGGHRLGCNLRSGYIFKFIWMPGDFGLYNNMSFRDKETLFKDRIGNTINRSKKGNSVTEGGSILRYFVDELGKYDGIRTNVPSNSSEEYFITSGQGSRDNGGYLGETRNLSGSGAWVCVSMEKLMDRNVYDYGSVNPVIKFTGWDQGVVASNS